MDRDDPEIRIVELERRLDDASGRAPARADPVAGQPRQLPVGGQSAVGSRFVASANRSTWWGALIGVAITGAFVGVPWAVHAVFHVAPGMTEVWLHIGIIVLLIPFGLLALLFGRTRGMRSLAGWPGPAMVLIRLTSDGLEVTRGKRRSEVFPVNTATMGPWISTRAD